MSIPEPSRSQFGRDDRQAYALTSPLLKTETKKVAQTTQFGGTGTCSTSGFLGCGTVFNLDTSGNETVLHSFTSSGGDGQTECYDCR